MFCGEIDCLPHLDLPLVHMKCCSSVSDILNNKTTEAQGCYMSSSYLLSLSNCGMKLRSLFISLRGWLHIRGEGKTDPEACGATPVSTSWGESPKRAVRQFLMNSYAEHKANFKSQTEHYSAFIKPDIYDYLKGLQSRNRKFPRKIVITFYNPSLGYCLQLCWGVDINCFIHGS